MKEPRINMPIPFHRTLLVVCTVVMTSGCYTFQPAAPAEIVAGQDVRARVSGAYADSLGPILLTDDARLVEGAVVSNDASGVMLEVTVNSELQGMRLETLRQRIEIPSDELVEIEVRELSKARTYGAIGLVAAAAIGLIVAQLNADSGGASLPGGGGPVESVVSPSGLSIPFGLLGALVGR